MADFYCPSSFDVTEGCYASNNNNKISIRNLDITKIKKTFGSRAVKHILEVPFPKIVITSELKAYRYR